ncbi:MAG: hypothetical protein KDC48_19475 [Planctomycetes bacterium]|nr:hypothetical protein [Planctomycetota bacterium]
MIVPVPGVRATAVARSAIVPDNDASVKAGMDSDGGTRSVATLAPRESITGGLDWHTARVDEDIERQVRALQIRSVVRLMPLTAMVNALNVVFVLAVFRDST